MNERTWNKWNDAGGPDYPSSILVQHVFRLMGKTKSDKKTLKVLDMGCGSGVHTVFFAENGFDTYGCDISSVGISNTKNRLKAKGLTAKLSARCDEYEPNSFDFIACFQVLECVSMVEAKTITASACRFLKRGGRSIFYFMAEGDYRGEGENQYGLHGYSRMEVEDLFSQAKFTSFEIDYFSISFKGGQSAQRDWVVSAFK